MRSTACRTIWGLLLLLAVAGGARADDGATVWTPWERALVSDRAYDRPCVDVQVRVRFDGPGGATRAGMAFWDGGTRYVIRCCFPAPGEWRWRTTCTETSNRGLHAQAGVMRVGSLRASTNPLVAHGYPRVSDDRRTLAYADGTPLLWIGDTCWAAPVHATDIDWRSYIANRARKGYTVLQVSIAPDWALAEARRPVAPFLSTLPDITKPNPAYFQRLDRLISAANARGLVVLMVGLIETPYRYPPPAQVATLSRYVAARYAAHAVIFSPSFDSGIREAETLASAEAVREAAPSSLVTMHMGTGVGPRFHNANWLSFDMVQSGHNGGDARRQSARAVGMPAEVLALPGRKPVINGEAIYEGDLGGAYDVRRTAWLSVLSGAVGYTAGINQLYRWDDDAPAMMDAPSSDQVGLLGRVLRAVPWWTLDPAPGRILNQPDDRARLMAFALTPDRSLGVAYLPGNAAVELDLSGLPATCRALWVSPSTGRWRTGASVTPSPKVSLTPPDERDWLLVLAAPGSPAVARLTKALDAVATRAGGPNASITFGADAPIDGLVRKEPRDGEFGRATSGGAACIVNQNPTRSKYLYLDLDDRIAFRGGARGMAVEVRLQSDDGLDGIALEFDATGAGGSAYRSVLPASQKQAGGWTTLTFQADAPYLGNRQNSGADMRVCLNGHRCRVASVAVRLDGLTH
jgi:hypothetical protein